MIDLSLVKSIIIINISGLNMPIKRQGTTLDLKKKKRQVPSAWCLQEMHITYKDRGRLKVKWQKKMYT